MPDHTYSEVLKLQSRTSKSIGGGSFNREGYEAADRFREGEMEGDNYSMSALGSVK